MYRPDLPLYDTISPLLYGFLLHHIPKNNNCPYYIEHSHILDLPLSDTILRLPHSLFLRLPHNNSNCPTYFERQ